MNSTEAWVLHEGTEQSPARAQLRREAFALPELRSDQARVEPLFGCWEANMAHAVARHPVDVCRLRKEDPVVIGNSGVVRVLGVGADVKGLVEGDVCAFFGTGVYDAHGYMVFAHAYDAPNTIGLLARRAHLPARNLLKLPVPSRLSLAQWAAFSLRYVTAWSNWKAALGCYRLQMSEEDMPAPIVWGWGGGTTFAELDLARRHGCRTTMLSGRGSRLALIAQTGTDAVDRSEFAALEYDERSFAKDPSRRALYMTAEATFLRTVHDRTGGDGVSIFLDYIGSPVARATLKALARQGVIATAGWKHGMEISYNRAVACIRRHSFIHTHYARVSDALAAMAYAEATGWMPPLDGRIFAWDEIPTLAAAYAEGRLDTYFPIYQVNAV